MKNQKSIYLTATHFLKIGCVVVFVLTLNIGFGQDIAAIKKEVPFQIKGNISAGMWFYTANGISNRRQPFSWYLTGSPMLKIYGMTFPFTMTVSEQDRRFSQPFNRYGVSPYYKWFTLHAGYRNVKFSDFTLAGVTMLGGGFEINPGKLRLGVMVGQINRPISEDTLTKDLLGRNIIPTYRRMGYAFKLGFGKQNNFFDLLFFKGKDDISSIAKPIKNKRITPAENAVLGIKTRFTIFKGLSFDADVAMSAFTKNQLASKLDKNSLAELSFLGDGGGLLTINSTTGLYKAIRSSLTYGFGIGSVAAQYERIDQDFQSLGSFFFNNDNEQWTLSPSFSVFNNTVTVSGSYGVAHDNLNSKKYATTYRAVGALNLGVQVSEKLNVGVNFANFGTNQNRGVGELFNDTTAISIVNNSYGINAGYNDTDESRIHSLNFSAGYQDANDQNKFTRDLTAVTSLFGNASYTYSLIENQASYTLSVNYNQTQIPNQTITTLGPVVSFSQPFLDKKLRTSLSGTYFLRKNNEVSDGNTTSLTGSVAYTLKKNTLTLSSSFLNNSSKTQANNSFNELRTSLAYSHSF